MAERSEARVLELLRQRGAHRLRGIRFRANRSTIWSLTRGGSVLNLHVAYRAAPREVFECFAVIAREAHRKTPAYQSAAETVRNWEGLGPVIDRIRRETRSVPARSRRRPPTVGPCCATEEQREYLRRLYRHLNRERFDGRLPPDVPIRLSNRMRTRIGQMAPGRRNGTRFVVEIALNVDLMLEGNGRERVDTLVHEMAHAAEWLFEGRVGHGPGWRRWARLAGCRERACTDAPIRRREEGKRRVTRVPRLPAAARAA